jgi:hypothetical protein
MGKAKHTPGPWHIKRNPVRLAVRDKNGDYIAEDIRGEKEEREANAALIAAAPDLLYAIQAFVDYFEQAGIGSNLTGADEEDGVNGFDGDTVFNVRQAKAAIAKAEGN